MKTFTYFDERIEHVFLLPIKGYPDYMITVDGRVISYKGERPIILKPKTDENGYKFVNLFPANNANVSENLKKHGQPKKIHRIVAETFVLGQYVGLEVDHIDRNLSNNRAENLRWVTHKVNMNNMKCHKPIKVDVPSYFLNYLWR